MEDYMKVRSPGIAEFPGAMVVAGENLFLCIVHAFLTVVLLTATCIVVFNPVLFQNTVLVVVIGGIALLDLWISHHVKQGG